MKHTFGKNRLGSGNKMKVDLKAYERSTHDLGFIFRTSQSIGTLVPFLCEVALPGDTWDIDLNAIVKTHPTLGPLFGSFKVQLDVFQCPFRLYMSSLMNNTVNFGQNAASAYIPKIQQNVGVTSASSYYLTPDNTQINPSSVLSYLGLRGWGLNLASGNPIRSKNAIPLLAYWDIYKNYYANNQETTGVYLLPPSPTAQGISSITVNGASIPNNGNTPPGTWITATSSVVINYTGTTPDLTQLFWISNGSSIRMSDWATWTITATTMTANLGTFAAIQVTGWYVVNVKDLILPTTFPLTNIDAMKDLILTQSRTTQLNITQGNAAPYGPTLALANSICSQCGLGIKTYQSDLFNNWLNSSYQNTIGSTTAVSTSGNSFKIDALILARKIYDVLNRIYVSGQTYQDWITAVYDHEPFNIANSPIYHGGLSKELVFQEVISQAFSNSQPLGTIGGKGVMSDKHKGGKIRIKINEPSYIMGIVSLTPRIDYSQGNKWDSDLLTIDDLHKPGLDEIGFQPLIGEYAAWWDTKYNGVSFTQNGYGFQPSWIQYQSNVNRTFGNFALPNNEMFMTLNRRYEMATNGTLKDFTTYIDPAKYNFIFAYTNTDAQNFWTQIGVGLIVRRKMSARAMPQL